MNFKNQLEKRYYARMSKYFIIALVAIYAAIGAMHGMGFEKVFTVIFLALMLTVFASLEMSARVFEWGLESKMHLSLLLSAMPLFGIGVTIYMILLPRETAYGLLMIVWPALIAMIAAYILATNSIIKEKAY